MRNGRQYSLADGSMSHVIPTITSASAKPDTIICAEPELAAKTTPIITGVAMIGPRTLVRIVRLDMKGTRASTVLLKHTIMALPIIG